MLQPRAIATWALLAAAIALPVGLSIQSPLLEWRQPVYIAAGLAGVIGLALMLMQPLLAGGYLPGLGLARSRRVHRLIGGTLVLAVIIHVAALWVTSPPDAIDALLLASPTPFSVWGVAAMWAVFASAVLATFRKSLRLRLWRLLHSGLAVVIVLGSVIHALLIQGTMETISKVGLCILVLAATAKAVSDLRAWSRGPRPR